MPCKAPQKDVPGWWRMRLVAGPSLKVVLWKRVHRVENWVSNLFKYYFFSSGGLF
jgi:hypothetical protein